MDRDDPFGVICLNLDIYMLTSTITSALNVPDFELSTSEYYLVKPVDTESGQKFPQIIATFNSKNLESIKMPKSQYFTDVTQDVDELFGKNRNYSLNVQQLNFTKNYYIMPVTTYNVNDKNEVTIYLIVINNFEKAELNTQSRNNSFFIAILIPSAILFVISALVMGLIMRPIFSKLKESSTLMSEYCHYIKKNDLNL